MNNSITKRERGDWVYWPMGYTGAHTADELRQITDVLDSKNGGITAECMDCNRTRTSNWSPKTVRCLWCDCCNGYRNHFQKSAAE